MGWRTYSRGDKCRFTCAFRSSSSIRHMPFTNPSLSSEPVPAGSHSILHADALESVLLCSHIKRESYQMTRSVSLFSLDSFQIARITLPSSCSSAPTSSSTEPARDAGALAISSGFVMRSTESPRQPAAWRGLRGGDFARSTWRAAMTFALNTVS